jgi:MoaA/NifB/PqqE/SkfB family radical SAM enzyme
MSAMVAYDLWIKRRPFLLYLKPTARCDLRCLICNRWQQPETKDTELSLEEIRAILQKFRQAGCVVLTLWGGEPTLRRDLSEILQEAKSLGFKTSMCSNCNSLARKADQLLPYLDILLCSLDGLGTVHDEMRGVNGLFERVVQSIQVASRFQNCEVKIWASVHRRSREQIAPLAALAAELGVGIEFFPLAAIDEYNDGLLLDTQEEQRTFAEVWQLKKQGAPIRNTDRGLKLLRDHQAIQCNFGRISIHVNQHGQVYSCEDSLGRPYHQWGDWRSFSPGAVFGSAEFHQVAHRLRQCQGCRLPCAVDLSGNLTAALVNLSLLKR